MISSLSPSPKIINEEKVIKYVRKNFDLQFMIEENLNMFKL